MMTEAAKVRQKLVEALKINLIGPLGDDSPYMDEILSQPPSQWYLTGFLVPDGSPPAEKTDDDSNQDAEQVNDNSGDEQITAEKTSARQAFFPSSMGLSFLVPNTAKTMMVTVEWGEYQLLEKAAPEPSEETEESKSLPDKNPIIHWQRTAHKETVNIPMVSSNKVDIPNSKDLKLTVILRPVAKRFQQLPEGTQTISVFLVNSRSPSSPRDLSYVFQTSLTIETPDCLILGRPNMRDLDSTDMDEQINDLQYRDDYEYVVGHNVSAQAVVNPDGTCNVIKTEWIPTAEVEKVDPENIANVEFGIEAIAAAPSAADLKAMLSPMITGYTAWITEQSAKSNAINLPQRSAVAKYLLENAAKIRDRMALGLESFDDPQVFQAFQIANRAIATAIRQRATHNQEISPEDVAPPQWRPFQLAFILMNLTGISDPEHRERNIVDLLFFPTGGGKTEAYLGIAAFTLVLRRLKNGGIYGAGVSIIMRYTLRLLTLDQLGRAATLICALELERQNNKELLGSWPFEIGLWVGQSATPNRMGGKGDEDENTARKKVRAFRNDTRNKPLPIPLDSCPWCGEKFGQRSFNLLPNDDYPRNLNILCVNRKQDSKKKPKCVFNGNNHLPIVAVDDSIYERLPCFLIATVDKFASLPWVGKTAALFGKVERYDSNGFYTSAEDKQQGKLLDKPLLPPDLIIQDELHLISGPLGTMVGLYETAIDALCTREINGKNITPKIIASTATVRRAAKQISALFAHTEVDVFPPPGPDRRDSFFAKTVSTDEKAGRLYIGVTAQGRSLKVILLRTYLTLLSTAKKAWDENGGKNNPENPADSYMTLLGYFNSLRELGGSRRIVEDEVKSQLSVYSERRRVGETKGILSDRKISNEPMELTSRVNTSEIAEAKRRLSLGFQDQSEGPVDVALATNMISVGLDITRLGLMVVLGQPKSTSEYIQATSRVGRDEKRPGLVITLFNIHRPRDRSHYERFNAWHNSFYRNVEATSVTPFSPRALDRGLVAVTVALARLGKRELTHPLGALEIIKHRPELDFVADIISKRADNEEIKTQVNGILDDWEYLATHKGNLQYQQEVGRAPNLLFDPLDQELLKQSKKAQKFKANRSLRDVEPVVNLWVRTPNDEEQEDESS